jgi:hypothetical protein
MAEEWRARWRRLIAEGRSVCRTALALLEEFQALFLPLPTVGFLPR